MCETSEIRKPSETSQSGETSQSSEISETKGVHWLNLIDGLPN